MKITEILDSIDDEIARLQEARVLLTGAGTSTRSNAASKKKAASKRVMSAGARKRIGDAQRKRWAARKTAAK